jgi:hypothetical protein
MSPLAVGMMIAICGLVWGGFSVLLRRAVRQEGLKSKERKGAAKSG